MKSIKKLFRKVEVLFGKHRFYESTTPQGYRYVYDYVDGTISYPLKDIALKDIALKLGFASLEEAFKSDIFQQGIKDLGCDINKLAYTVDYE